ncbi:hypothetical protein EMMF5_004136 [Cystobasidiomycetes sp. EMM_F5]
MAGAAGDMHSRAADASAVKHVAMGSGQCARGELGARATIAKRSRRRRPRQDLRPFGLSRCARLKEECSYAPLPGKQDSVEWLREKLEEARATIRSMAEAAQNAPSSGAVTGTETPMFIRSSAGTPDNSQSIGNRHSSDDPTESVAELVHHNVNMDLGGIPSGKATPPMFCGTQDLAEAKQLLMIEMEKPTSVPTIQGPGACCETSASTSPRKL